MIYNNENQRKWKWRQVLRTCQRTKKSYGTCEWWWLSLLLLSLFSSWKFFTSILTGGFHCILSDSKSPWVYRTLLSILAYLSNAMIWKVSILFQSSSFPCLFWRSYGIVPYYYITPCEFFIQVFANGDSKVSSNLQNSSWYWGQSYHYSYPLRVFHTSISWWSFTEV